MKLTIRLLTGILIYTLLASGCAAPTPQPTANPDAALLAGTWEQFIVIASMPQEISLETSGSAVVDNNSGHWRLDGANLYLRQGSVETQYSYTVSGYMMTLYDTATDTSEFYINPDKFSAGADKNAAFAGQWAAWSTFGMMSFDGGTDLDNIYYTTAGRTDTTAKYAARDDILQTEDEGGNYTYNLYSFNSEGALLLADTVDYDNDNKNWTPYWKKAQPPAGLLADWTQVIDTSSGGAGLPVKLSLSSGGAAKAAVQGTAMADIKWEYYGGGFIVIAFGPTNLQYVWCTPQGTSLYLGNPDTGEGWYINSSLYEPTVAPLSAVAGTWALEGSKMKLDFKANGSIAMTNDAGETTTLSAAAMDGMVRLQKGDKTYYMSYSVDSDTMKVYYNNLPFLDSQEMPVSLTKS